MSQEGTQAIRRAADILRRIARVSSEGSANLRDISESLDLPRSTAHRILKCLTETGLAAYSPEKRTYEIGMLGYELGLAVSENVLDLAPFVGAVDRVAQRANVTAYLMRRSGMEAVCLHKAEAKSPIRVIPVEVGQRRFLGIGAGSTALLAGLSDASLSLVLNAIGPRLDGYNNLDQDTVSAAVAKARQTGFAESYARVYDSIYGLGKTIDRQMPEPDLAISIAAHTSTTSEETIATWKAILSEEVNAVSAQGG